MSTPEGERQKYITAIYSRAYDIEFTASGRTGGNCIAAGVFAVAAASRVAALEEAAGIAKEVLRSEMVAGRLYWALRVRDAIRAAKEETP